MSKEYEGQSEAEQGYWFDVHYYMEQNNCDKQTAIKAIEKIYDDYSKNRNKPTYKCYLNGYFYGSGSLDYMRELFTDYVVTSKMYDKDECEFKIVKS